MTRSLWRTGNDHRIQVKRMTPAMHWNNNGIVAHKLIRNG